MTLDARSGKLTASFAAMRPWLPAAIETSKKKPCLKAGPEVEAHPVQIPRAAGRTGTLARQPPMITLLAKAANPNAGQRQAKVDAAVSHLLDCNCAGDRVTHVSGLVGGARLQYQRSFAGNQRSAE